MVLLALFGTMFSATVQGFLESFLEEYLKIFGLSVTQIGLSFLCKWFILVPQLLYILTLCDILRFLILAPAGGSNPAGL